MHEMRLGSWKLAPTTGSTKRGSVVATGKKSKCDPPTFAKQRSIPTVNNYESMIALAKGYEIEDSFAKSQK